ncbi:hypothetical protein FA95DRAFT_1565656 [Auriscalpium vulgare]|uniref:Uncharacterized protein n=1 Tax=Auriscalpium vulgare TaxID=40419 RepID=A0ACB8RAJ2_9AGAM|nr:hypothetical protein FA95DRAFT_1565656 [Auriscalpium vulgare]
MPMCWSCFFLRESRATELRGVPPPLVGRARAWCRNGMLDSAARSAVVETYDQSRHETSETNFLSIVRARTPDGRSGAEVPGSRPQVHHATPQDEVLMPAIFWIAQHQAGHYRTRYCGYLH